MKAKYVFAAVALGAAVIAQAVPAKRDFRTVTQPDGTTLVIQKVGDESMHFTLTADGVLVTRDADGQYSYARVDAASGAVVSSGVRAVDAAVRPESHRYLVQNIGDLDVDKIAKSRVTRAHNLNAANIAAMRAKAPAQASQVSDLPQSGLGRFSGNFPRYGKIKGLVILVEYQDVKFSSTYQNGARSYFNDMLHKDGFSEFNGTGCAAEYFREQSNGLFDPEFDLYGPVTLPQKMAYYGGNDYYGDDQRPHEMVVDACKLLDSSIDFTQYDNDGDGYVDNVFVFYAGQGEASYGSDDTVWPHSWEVSAGLGTMFKLDGVYIDRYACTNEWERSRPDGVGTFIHEFSHVMGLPDLYHTSSSSATYTPGSWSVLDYGPYNNDGCTPPCYSIYERNAMGWINPRVLDGTPCSVSLENIADSNDGCLIATSKDTEFFLLENRQQKGWDKYLPGHGMLIWHVDFVQSVFDQNVVNNTRSHQYVDIVEANNNPSGSTSALPGYSWPGTANKTAFDSTTTPALKNWAGNAIDVPISDISEKDGVITFAVSGGMEKPVAGDVEQKGTDWFQASWSPVEEALAYELTVNAVYSGGGQATESADMTGTKLPEGWTTNVTSTYTSTGNYGAASPSLKIDNNAKYVQTVTYPGDISKLTFWAKYNGNATEDTRSALLIEALVPSSAQAPGMRAAAADNWQTVETLRPASQGTTYTYDADRLPAGTRAMRFTMHKTSGNIALDDVTVEYGGRRVEAVEGYNPLNVGNVTGHTVRNLPGDADHFEYSVVAVSANGKSLPSNTVSVTLSRQDGVDGIGTDSDSESVRATGLALTVTTSAPAVDVYDTTGRHIAHVRVSGGTAVVNLPAAGLYLVKSLGTHKVLVK